MRHMTGRVEAPPGQEIFWRNQNSNESGKDEYLIVDDRQIYRIMRALPGESKLPKNIDLYGYEVFDVDPEHGVSVIYPSGKAATLAIGEELDLKTFKLIGIRSNLPAV